MPETIDSIDELIEKGRKIVKARIIAGASDPIIANAEVYLRKALELIQAGDVQNPEKEYEARMLLAVDLTHNQKRGEAVPHFERCVELRPQDLNARINLARVYSDLGKSTESARQYKEAAKLFPILSIGRYSNLAYSFIQSLRR